MFAAFVCSKNPADVPSSVCVHEKDFDLVGVMRQIFFFFLHMCVSVSVYVCFQVAERGGSLQQETREWSEGNRKEMTRLSQNCHSPFVVLNGNLDTHTQSLLLL